MQERILGVSLQVNKIVARSHEIEDDNKKLHLQKQEVEKKLLEVVIH